MELTPKDHEILRSAVAHGRYRPQGIRESLCCVRMVEIQLLSINDSAPGVFTITRLGEQLMDALEHAD